MAMKLFVDVSQLVLPHAKAGGSREPMDVIPHAALLVESGHVVATGPEHALRSRPEAQRAEIHSLHGNAVIPGLIDSHTHIVFAGDRIDELDRRTRGETYEQIAQAGGGIVRSVESLRQASRDDIIRSSHRRLQQMLACGTTTCEIKTGYGLEPTLELLQLELINGLAALSPVDVLPTVLAHVIPRHQQHDRPAYVQRFCSDVVAPAAKQNMAVFFDVFVEQGAFCPDEARTLIAFARNAGLGIKLHVDQLHEGGGGALAAEVNALSADHLEQTSATGREALAQAGVTATILPACTFYLGQKSWPDGRALRKAGCEVAIATDCNPGSAMIANLPLCGTMAATQCGLTLQESLWGMTRGGAKALGLQDRGRLQPGERADFVVLAHPDWRAIFYEPSHPPIREIFITGQSAWTETPPRQVRANDVK